MTSSCFYYLLTLYLHFLLFSYFSSKEGLTHFQNSKILSIFQGFRLTCYYLHHFIFFFKKIIILFIILIYFYTFLIDLRVFNHLFEINLQGLNMNCYCYLHYLGYWNWIASVLLKVNLLGKITVGLKYCLYFYKYLLFI